MASHWNMNSGLAFVHKRRKFKFSVLKHHVHLLQVGNGVIVLSGVRMDVHRNFCCSCKFSEEGCRRRAENYSHVYCVAVNSLELHSALRVCGLSQRCCCVPSCWMWRNVVDFPFLEDETAVLSRNVWNQEPIDERHIRDGPRPFWCRMLFLVCLCDPTHQPIVHSVDLFISTYI